MQLRYLSAWFLFFSFLLLTYYLFIILVNFKANFTILVFVLCQISKIVHFLHNFEFKWILFNHLSSHDLLHIHHSSHSGLMEPVNVHEYLELLFEEIWITSFHLKNRANEILELDLWRNPAPVFIGLELFH